MSKLLKSFVEGMGQALDLGGTLAPRHTRTGPEADAAALSGDWQRVGQDMHRAVVIVGHEVRDHESSRSMERDLVHVG